jgi:hypothetical protein
MRSRDLLLAVVAAVGVTTLYPTHGTVSAQSGAGMVISEFRFRGPSGVNDEFIELFNAGNTPVNISGWLIRSSNNVQPPGFFTRATIPANTIVNPGCYYLVANTASGGFSGGVAPDHTYSVGIADDGGVALTTTSSSVIVDQVGQGTAPTAYGEGQRLPMVNTNVNRGLERRPGGAAGHVDTNNNFADFGEIIPANPQNSSTCLATHRLPHDVQGAGAMSPMTTGTPVTVRGVVTARSANGFFIQTEPGQEDADAATSEGLFVGAAGPALAAAMVGRVVHATGLVSEANGMTQLATASSVIDVGAAALPAPVAVTSAELSDVGTLDQLERFEGMRVSVASLTAVSGTEAGAFYAVLTGQARTFREPGIPAGQTVPPCAIGPCNIPLFDGNPERLRVDSDGLEAVAAAQLSSGAIVTDAIGPLGFSDGIYTLLPETVLAPSGGTSSSVATAALGHEFTVASFMLGETFATQMPKASLLIRHTLGSPDIIAVQDAADLATLHALAAAVDADAVAAGQAAPAYGVAQGFLFKQAGGRVALLSVEPIDAEPASPLVLRAVVSAPAQLPQTITVIASELDALPAGDPGPEALAARQARAESLASFIQSRQSNDPGEAIVALGNYNAHRFNDGYVDVVGTVLGTPVSPDQVATEPHDLVSPDLISAGDSLDPSHRYSSILNGNAQLLDHVLMSASVAVQFAGIAYPRVNADFPDAHRDDATVPNRLSDRDPVVAYFTFPPDVDAPVFSFMPADQLAEATGPDGAPVHFAVPTATDNLDAVVNVTCSPATGSVFPIGSTGVTCSAQDVAGNYVEASFSVTVTLPIFGRMQGAGTVVEEGQRAWFMFDVRDSARLGERGWVVLQLRDGRGRPDRYMSANVLDVRFSNASGYAPGVLPRSGVDTVTFSGIGHWNGAAGYRYEITASDRGEPGRRHDTFSLTVFGPGGDVVESVGGLLQSGNIQSLR